MLLVNVRFLAVIRCNMWALDLAITRLSAIDIICTF